MPMKLLLSHVKALPFDFDAEVAAFIKAKMDHRFVVDEPAPSPAHAWVEQAVGRVPGAEGHPDDFVADYEIEDDTPPPPTLDEQKQKLAYQAGAASMAAIARVVPPLKSRLWNIEYGRAKSAEEKTPADTAIIAAHEERLEKIAAIQHHLAMIESDIDDLTEQTIAAWRQPPFPGA